MYDIMVSYSLITYFITGEHPRMGALDVCPFIPVTGVTMTDCVRCSKEFGSKLANELNVPVYLYEHSSEQEHRKALQHIRSGEYEGLKEKVILYVKYYKYFYVYFKDCET